MDSASATSVAAIPTIRGRPAASWVLRGTLRLKKLLLQLQSLCLKFSAQLLLMAGGL